MGNSNGKTHRDDGSFSFSGVSWILKTHLEKEKPSQDVNGRLFIDKQKEATMKTLIIPELSEPPVRTRTVIFIIREK